MKNRNLSSPILCAVLLLIASFPPLSKAQSVDSTPTYTAPAAPPAPLAATTGVTAAPTLPKHTISYTVVKGDTLTSLAKKFNTTRKKLSGLNGLASNKLTPGQVLLIPSTKSAKTTAVALTSPTTAKSHHTYAMAQPVQDFDVPASTFGSCPVPLASPDDDPNTTEAASTTDETAAPVAKLVSPAEAAEEERKLAAPDVTILYSSSPVTVPDVSPVTAPVKKGSHMIRIPASVAAQNVPMRPLALIRPAPSGMASTYSARGGIAPLPFNPPAPHLTARGLNPSSSNSSSAMTTASNDWGSRFLQNARMLGNAGIEYDDNWRPPGEAHSWVMDCSNTSRYLYRITAGIELPRTASDQYYYLHLQGKAWDVPQNEMGLADGGYLRSHLKPGDLLFWENTYRPERQPPITHVMVFLGTNAQGQWIMAGSQSSRGGEHNRRNGGPDIYVFRPSQPCGGYTTWMGMVHHKGRFCAFGRPLEADRSKLSVASDN